MMYVLSKESMLHGFLELRDRIEAVSVHSMPSTWYRSSSTNSAPSLENLNEWINKLDFIKHDNTKS